MEEVEGLFEENMSFMDEAGSGNHLLHKVGDVPGKEPSSVFFHISYVVALDSEIHFLLRNYVDKCLSIPENIFIYPFCFPF